MINSKKNDPAKESIKALAKQIADSTSININDINYELMRMHAKNQLNTGFLVQKLSECTGVKHGYTFFWHEKSLKLELFYKYVEGHLDLLDSCAFSPDSRSFDYRKECISKNKKEQIKDPLLMYRFHVYGVGFLTLNDIYGDLFAKNNISDDDCKRYAMLPKRHDKLHGRYCKAKICACLGCDNMKFKNEQDFQKHSVYQRKEALLKAIRQ